MGRPLSLTDLVLQDDGTTLTRREVLIAAVADGNYFQVACGLAGVGKSTGHRWKQRGEALSESDRKLTAEETGLVELWEALQKAKAQGEARHVANIRRASGESWQASAWFLERTAPERWGRKDRLEVISKDRLDEEIERLTREMEQRAADGDPRAVETLADLKERE